MNLYHLFFVLLFLAFFAASYYLEGWRKLPVILVEIVLTVFCTVDYIITYYRGIGFVAADFSHKGALGITLSTLGSFQGKKASVCIMWIAGSVLVAVFGRRLSSFFYRFDKPKKLKEYFLMLPVLLLGVVIAVLTDYPNDVEFFRADSYFATSEGYYDTWYGDGKVICHALGETKEGLTLSNSLEALEYNYARGFRVFETDISVSSDEKLVLRHDWGSDLGQASSFGWGDKTWAMTEAEFLKTPLYGSYTPMNVSELFEYMKIHDDMYIVLDTKYDSNFSLAFQFEKLVEAAKNCGCEEVLSRVIVQLYYAEMYDEIEAIYDFDHYLLTLYVVGPDYMTNEQLTDFLLSRNIPVLTVPWYYDSAVCEVMRNNGLYTYVHTINDVPDASSRAASGFSGIYTDTITPRLFEILYEINGD